VLLLLALFWIRLAEQRPPLLFFCFSAHDTSGLGRSLLFDVLILNLCFSGLAMASGRMILFLVFLFNVPSQAPESCSSLSCDDGPTADMLECFWEEGKAPA
jgi:hypothetical protein